MPAAVWSPQTGIPNRVPLARHHPPQAHRRRVKLHSPRRGSVSNIAPTSGEVNSSQVSLAFSPSAIDHRTISFQNLMVLEGM
jgi:hypothetical protein